VLTAEVASGGEDLVFTVTHADKAAEQFTLEIGAGGEREPVVGRDGGDVRRLPSGRLERCLWLTLGTVFWPYCFYRYD
jgi:hypothetical protein